MRVRPATCIEYRWLLAATCLIGSLGLGACSSNSNSADEDVGDVIEETRIEGQVFDALNGEPISDALVTTDPPSETVATNAAGEYAIVDRFNQSGNYQVRATHPAYDAVQATATVAPNTSTRVDLPMQSNTMGLHVSATSLQFSASNRSQTIRLSSNVRNTGYTSLVSQPWILVTPSTGIIRNRESVFLTISVELDELDTSQQHSGEILINADNGTRELLISVVVQPTGELMQDATVTVPLTHSNQTDCRRVDVFRVGYQEPAAELIQFVESAQLPRDIGTRGLRITNPFLVDSFVLTELGTVTVRHVSGGTSDSDIVVFEMNLNERIAEIGNSGGVSVTDRRASVSVGLVPGVYCYYLNDSTSFFNGTNDIVVEFDFEPPQ